MGRHDGELDLRTRTDPTPCAELTSYELGALVHATQAEVPFPRPFSHHFGIDALIVVANAQAKVLLVVPKLYLN